jgi:hypothetical protein
MTITQRALDLVIVQIVDSVRYGNLDRRGIAEQIEVVTSFAVSGWVLAAARARIPVLTLVYTSTIAFLVHP